MIKKIRSILIFSFFYFLLFSLSSFAQSQINDSLCIQVQCVKIQNGHLFVLSSDNVTYVPYFIKAVGYQPTPIGRHPSDWGYAATDPRSAINNIYDDPAILTRDFNLLQQMNANTLRIWSGVDQLTPAGEFTNYLTMNTLDTAQQYGLKIIPGFWVNPLTFDASNNISSTDQYGNTITPQQIINNFVAYVNTFKGSPGVLFWAIGNENNLQTPQMTAPQLINWYALVNEMAQAAHNAEGPYFHPVALVNGEITEIGNSTDGATDADLPSLDIWGANIYRGESFGTLFTQYAAKSQKPLWISEYGMDAFDTTTNASIIAEINNWQNQMTDPSIISQEGTVDTGTQSSWDGALWNQIYQNVPVTIGGSLMEYSDEWWSPNEWMCTLPNPDNNPVIQSENITSEAYCVSTHSNFGFTFDGASQDNYTNSEWFGVMSISSNPVAGGADIMTPRPVYSNLQTQWQLNPWSQFTVYPTGLGEGTISSSSSSFGSGFNCNVVSNIATGTCKIYSTLNQPVTLTFSSTDNSIVTNWGIAGCTSGSNACVVTPDTDISLNATISPPVSFTVTIPTPVSPDFIVAGTNVTITALASETGGTISKVAFYNGATLVSTSTSSPYTYTWNNVPAGSYNITAVATDSSGATVTSAITAITAGAASPEVMITAPAAGTTITAGSNVSMTAVAIENYGGVISKVAFYNGATLLGTVTSGPSFFTYTWNNVPAGTYNLTAVATDSIGTSTTSSPVTLNVNPLTSPVVTITAPANPDYIVAGTNLAITATASESGGTIKQVAFYNGTTLLGTSTSSPYTYNWNNVPAGYYNLTAVATDVNGMTGASSIVSVAAAAASPQVTITGPASGTTVTAGSNVSMTAVAIENYGGVISKVAFYNGATLLGTVTSGPSFFTYTWTNVPAGTYNLTAVATDSVGTSTTSLPVTLNVTALVSPVVTITAPANPDYIVAGTNLAITATASESGGTIKQVAFYNGATLLGTSTSSPYTYNWTNVPAGYYNLTAVATDGNGMTGASSIVSVAAAAASPQVTIISPASGTTVTAGSNISISVVANENYGGIISQVAFYNGAALLGTVTSGPNFFTYTWTNVPAGTYNLTAVATDSIGTSTTSSPVSINSATPFTVPGAPTGVTATILNSAASVSFNPPASNGGSGITLYTATSSPGGLTGTGTTLGVPITVTGLTNGTAYTFTVTATNAAGTSAPSIASSPVTPEPMINVFVPIVDESGNGLWLFGPVSRTAVTVAPSLQTSAISPTVMMLRSVQAGTYNITLTSPAAVYGFTMNFTVVITPQEVNNATYQNNGMNVPAVTASVYPITPTAGSNGTISPAGILGLVEVSSGASQTFTITPNSGYNISQVLVDGAAVAPSSSYTFTNVTAAHTITASFTAISSAIIAGTGGASNASVSAGVTSDVDTNDNGTLAQAAAVTSPANGKYVTTGGGNLTITADASSGNEGVSSVAFYANNTDGDVQLLGTATSSPYTFTWTNVPAGTYNLTAVATDGVGNTSTLSAASITVNPQ